MNKVILYIATSLDGFIADSDGGVDWLPQPNDPDSLEIVGYNQLIKHIGIIVMGSKSYNQILSFGEWAWPDKQTYVFTSQNLTTKQPCIEFVKSNPKALMEELNITLTNKNIWLLGGAELISSFAKEKLIDEVIITIIPVKLEKGIKLELPWNDFIISSTKPCMDSILQKIYKRKEA